MKKNRVFVLCTLLFLIPIYALSDIITLTDGSKVNGRILSSTERYVRIRREDSRSAQILHSEIKSIFFTWADMVYLSSGEKLKCKIVNRSEPDLLVVSTKGLQRIPLTNIKMYFYHSAEDLEVTELPITGPDFKNEKPFPTKGLSNTIYFGLNGGAHWPPIKKWKKEFMSPAWLFTGGAKVGYYLTKSLSIGGGFEFDTYRQTHYENIDTRYSTYYFYGSVEYAQRIEKNPASYVFIGTDVGLFKTRGTLYLYSYRDIEFNVNNIAFMPRIGARTFGNQHISFSIEMAYLFAKSGSIDIPLVVEDTLVIDFSGFKLFFGIFYYL